MALLQAVLSIANNALDELGLSRLNSQGMIPSVYATGRMMERLLIRQGRDLRDAKESGWTIMQRVYTFNSAAGTAEYALPSDYVRLINDTVWNRTKTFPMQGPLSPFQWQVIKSGLIGTGAYSQRYRVVRAASGVSRKFVIDPTPTAIEALAFEYLSTDWCCVANQSSTLEPPTADTDLCLFDDDLMTLGLMWRYRRAKGQPYLDLLAEYNEKFDVAAANDAPAQDVCLSGPDSLSRLIGYDNIPETGFGA